MLDRFNWSEIGNVSIDELSFGIETGIEVVKDTPSVGRSELGVT